MKREELKVRRAMKGAGLGLYTLRAVKKGERIIEYTGEIIDDAEYERRNSKYIFSVGKDHNIDGAGRTNLARYINHSCRPNCEATEEDKRIFIEAKRNIMLGEELTYDYGKWYWNTFIKDIGCQCVKCAETSSSQKSARHPSDKTVRRVSK